MRRAVLGIPGRPFSFGASQGPTPRIRRIPLNLRGKTCLRKCRSPSLLMKHMRGAWFRFLNCTGRQNANSRAGQARPVSILIYGSRSGHTLPDRAGVGQRIVRRGEKFRCERTGRYCRGAERGANGRIVCGSGRLLTEQNGLFCLAVH